MKQKSLLAILLLISFSCFAGRKYTIPKDDLIKQFNAGLNPDKIYCYREDGRKVWLFFNKSTILTIKLINNTKKDVMLHTVRHTNGIIAGRAYNVWWSTKKIYTMNIDEVASFHIERKFQESEMDYVDIDSSRKLVRSKNDSLKSEYLKRDELMISWIARKDTLLIRENACYNMVFKDGNHTEYGVVQRITTDSIYISNVFNHEWAAANKKEYRVYGYALQDILQLRLLKAGGLHYKTIDAGDYQVIATKANKPGLPLPCWYGANPATGDSEFYRAWLTDSGFLGIMEKNGKVYWYEGT